MKRYIKSTSYKSGDRYYGGLPQEPSTDKYAQALSDARNSFQKFLSDNNVTERKLKSWSNATEKLYTWITPDNQNIKIVYYDSLSGDKSITELYIDGRKVDVYKSGYDGWCSLRKAPLMNVITSFNTNNGKLFLVFYN